LATKLTVLVTKSKVSATVDFVVDLSLVLVTVDFVISLYRALWVLLISRSDIVILPFTADVSDSAHIHTAYVVACNYVAIIRTSSHSDGVSN